MQSTPWQAAARPPSRRPLNLASSRSWSTRPLQPRTGPRFVRGRNREEEVGRIFISAEQQTGTSCEARDTGRAMSQENMERLRAAIDALRGDRSELDWEATLAGAWVELWDPEIEWDASTHPLPDLAGVYQGIEPTLRWWREWLAAWEAVKVEYELVEAGDRVVGLFRQRMRGHYTGIDVASGKYAMVFTFRDGLIVHARFYARRSEALAAVGLSE